MNRRQHGLADPIIYDQPRTRAPWQRRFVKKNDNNVLPFPIASRPAAKQDSPPSTVFFQVGSDRFAFHMWCESLPPAPLRRRSQGASAEKAPPPLSPDRERRGPGARLKTATNLKVGRTSKPSLAAIPNQPNRATAATGRRLGARESPEPGHGRDSVPKLRPGRADPTGVD
jgi:hypothetical protein